MSSDHPRDPDPATHSYVTMKKPFNHKDRFLTYKATSLKPGIVLTTSHASCEIKCYYHPTIQMRKFRHRGQEVRRSSRRRCPTPHARQVAGPCATRLQNPSSSSPHCSISVKCSHRYYSNIKQINAFYISLMTS